MGFLKHVLYTGLAMATLSSMFWGTQAFAKGRDYYVDSNAPTSPGSCGAFDAKCQSIGTLLTQLTTDPLTSGLEPGDTVHVSGIDHAFGTVIGPDHSGTVDNPVRFIAMDSGAVFTQNTSTSPCLTIKAHYVHVEGFRCEVTDGAGILVDTANGILIQNNTITQSTATSATSPSGPAISLINANNATIKGNRVENYANLALNCAKSSTFSDNSTFEHNVISNPTSAFTGTNAGEIDIRCPGLKLRHNTLNSAHAGPLITVGSNATGLIITHNIIVGVLASSPNPLISVPAIWSAGTGDLSMATYNLWWNNSGSATYRIRTGLAFNDLPFISQLLISLNSISSNPEFVDPLNNNLHLLSQAGHMMNDGAWTFPPSTTTTTNSPAIDAGDLNSGFGLEPPGNGTQPNLGAYGNTPEASLTSQPSKIWTGDVSTDWNTSGNWMPNGVPIATNTVLIPKLPVPPQPNPMPNYPHIPLNTTANCGDLYITQGAKVFGTGAGSLNIHGSMHNFGSFDMTLDHTTTITAPQSPSPALPVVLNAGDATFYNLTIAHDTVASGDVAVSGKLSITAPFDVSEVLRLIHNSSGLGGVFVNSGFTVGTLEVTAEAGTPPDGIKTLIGALNVKGDIRVRQGNFIVTEPIKMINPNTVGSIRIDTGATLKVTGNGAITMDAGSSFDVSGTLELAGTSVSSSGSTARYGMMIRSGGTFTASDFSIEYLNDKGLQVLGDPSDISLTNGTFTGINENPAAGSQATYIDFGSGVGTSPFDITYNNIIFKHTGSPLPASQGGKVFNVTRACSIPTCNPIIFKYTSNDPPGALVGENFDSEPASVNYVLWQNCTTSQYCAECNTCNSNWCTPKPLATSCGDTTLNDCYQATCDGTGTCSQTGSIQPAGHNTCSAVNATTHERASVCDGNNIGCPEPTCTLGYERSTTLGDCIDVNECTTGVSICPDPQTCINTQGSYDCVDCASKCIDTDPCTIDSCSADGTCINTTEPGCTSSFATITKGSAVPPQTFTQEAQPQVALPFVITNGLLQATLAKLTVHLQSTLPSGTELKISLYADDTPTGGDGVIDPGAAALTVATIDASASSVTLTPITSPALTVSQANGFLVALKVVDPQTSVIPVLPPWPKAPGGTFWAAIMLGIIGSCGGLLSLYAKRLMPFQLTRAKAAMAGFALIWVCSACVYQFETLEELPQTVSVGINNATDVVIVPQVTTDVIESQLDTPIENTLTLIKP